MTYDLTYNSDGKPVGDAELFAGMKGAMKILNFSDDDMNEIWKIVATVMHLGNIDFGGISKLTVLQSSTLEKSPNNII